MKNIGNILLVTFVVFWIVIAFYNPTVPSEELTRLAKKAEGSPAATELLKTFLEKNPTPKEKDIREVRKAIEEAATARASQEITGSHVQGEQRAKQLLAEMEGKKTIEAEQQAFDKQVTNTPFWDLPLKDKARAIMTTYLGTVVKVGIGLALIGLVVALPLKMGPAKRGF